MKIYVVLLTTGAEVGKANGLYDNNRTIILQNNHLFTLSEEVFSFYQESKKIEFTVEGDITNLPQFVFDYFHGGSQIYFDYQHGRKYVCFIPYTDAEMTDHAVTAILGHQTIIQNNWVIALDDGRNIKTFRTLFPYSTQIFCLYEEGKELEEYLEFIQNVDIVIPHRVYHIPDRRGARPS